MRSMEIFEHWTVTQADLTMEDFFRHLGPEPFALLYGDGPDGRWIIHGEDPIWVLEDPQFGEISLERSGTFPPFFPDFIGFIGYEFGHRLEPLLPAPAFQDPLCPNFHFALHRRIRVLDRTLGLLFEGTRQMPGRLPACRHALEQGPFKAWKKADSDSPEEYEAKVARIREEIGRGNVYQVNLTRREQWGFEGDLTQFARKLYAVNPAPFSALLAGPGFTVISSSPERFLRIRDGRISTRPIKGTAPRYPDKVLDERSAEELLASSKNRSELAMIADLLRNDLARVCTLPSVRVEAFPTLETYANVHHLVATVSGDIKPGLTLLELLRGVFPGGSITGCPKIAAMKLIRELEEHPRQVYTGALGWFTHDLSQLDFNIPIRTVWAVREELFFGVGGGVVWDSDPRDEYLETVHKGRSIVQCLS